MYRRTVPLIAFVAGLSACTTSESPTALPLGAEAGLAKGGAGGGGGGGGGGPVLYRAKLIAELGTGELTSDWFPAAGFTVSASNPWKQVSFSNVTLNLNNDTNGQWDQGQCGAFSLGMPYSKSYWDIEHDPNVTYAGTWSGTVTFGKGYFAFDGDRVVDGVVMPALGGIHNVVTQQNPIVETAAGDKTWFQQQVRNAPFKFGSESAPNGTRLLGPEVACVNYTIVLQRIN